MTVREYMNRPFELNRLIRIRTNQLQSIRSLIQGTSVAINGLPHQESPDPHRLESLMAKVLDIEIEIGRLTDELGSSISEVTEAINSVNDPSCQEVLTARYLCFEDWTTIARKLNYCKDWVFRLHRKGMNLIRISP